MMDNNGFINEIAGVATLAICVMTFITFMITTGALESDFWESDLEGASIIGSDGFWGEDIIVTYTDGTTESVKGISNSIWSIMSIQNDGSKPISMIQYCINVLIPSSDTFDTLGYECIVSIVQDSIDFYQTSYSTVHFVDIKANEWTRMITVPLNIQTISDGWTDGVYTVSFENAGSIEGIDVPDGRSIDIAITDGVVTFLI